MQLRITLTNPAGHAVPSNRPVVWELVLPPKEKEPGATLTADGVLTGLRVGARVIVQATINQGTAKAEFTVVEAKCDPRKKECKKDGGDEAPPAGEPAPEDKKP